MYEYKKRLAIYFCCDHHRLRICNGAFRKREREREKERMRTLTVRGATTRARKRKIGQRDLWDVIVNNDDICFKHILPRLNRTDLKFLYEVNSETRKLIKRSSRARDLERGF